MSEGLWHGINGRVIDEEGLDGDDGSVLHGYGYGLGTG